MPHRQQILAVATLVAIPGAIVVAIGDPASVPSAIVVTAAIALAVSVLVFAVVTYHDARSSRSTFGSTLRRNVRTAGKVLLALEP